jgi:hypothetical protein
VGPARAARADSFEPDSACRRDGASPSDQPDEVAYQRGNAGARWRAQLELTAWLERRYPGTHETGVEPGHQCRRIDGLRPGGVGDRDQLDLDADATRPASRHEQSLHGSVQIHARDAVAPSGRPNQCWHLIGYYTLATG